MEPATQENLEAFVEDLTRRYEVLFTRPDYEIAAKRYTPAQLARKMALGMDCGSANKDGEGIKATCKALGIPHTYKAIRAYFAEK